MCQGLPGQEGITKLENLNADQKDSGDKKTPQRKFRPDTKTEISCLHVTFDLHDESPLHVFKTVSVNSIAIDQRVSDGSQLYGN